MIIAGGYYNGRQTMTIPLTSVLIPGKMISQFHLLHLAILEAILKFFPHIHKEFVVFYLEKVSKTQSLSWAEINLSHQPDYDDVILSTRFASWDLVLDKIWWTFVAFPNNHPLRA